MSQHPNSTTDLTRNQTLVMNALSEANGPLSAYTILDELREHGLRAPLQVYRALDKLVEFGLVHRLESINSFVACQHEACDGEERETVLFTICDACGSVQELADDDLISAINSLTGKRGFSLRESVIELRGKCSVCVNQR